MLITICQTPWDIFLASIKYPPGSMLAIFGISLITTLISTGLNKLLTDTKLLKEKQNIIKDHKEKRKEIEKLKEENPKKYKKEVVKWERQDKPIQKMQSKMGMQRMKPMCVTIIPMMIIFPLLAGFFNGPVAIPPMNIWDIPLIGQMTWGQIEGILPPSAGWINYITWYMLCSFTLNTIIGKLAGTQTAGGIGQMFDQAKYDQYKT